MVREIRKQFWVGSRERGIDCKEEEGNFGNAGNMFTGIVVTQGCVSILQNLVSSTVQVSTFNCL